MLMSPKSMRRDTPDKMLKFSDIYSKRNFGGGNRNSSDKERQKSYMSGLSFRDEEKGEAMEGEKG